MKNKKRIIPVLILFLAVLGSGLYVSDYYHADQTALEALSSDASVLVEKTDGGWVFDGPSGTRALVFYPGAKVETAAYAPLARELAREGMDVYLLEMPFHLAFLDIGAAGRVLDSASYEEWYVGGHSLGGAMAADYAAENGDRLAGLILLAAYPTKELDADLTEVLLYGSEDKVVNREKIREGEAYAPDSCFEYEIPGGNHAQFGSYGVQKGDGRALISEEDQQKETVRLILDSLGEGN